MSKSLRRVKAALAELGLEDTICKTAGAATAQMAADAVGCEVDQIGKSIIWSKKMFGKSRCCSRSTHFKAMRPTGNQAFDAYKHDTLTRLANEQEELLAFLERLRQAKDRAEFDNFLKERDSKAKADEKEEA